MFPKKTARERVISSADSSKANIKKKLIKTSKNTTLQCEDFSSIIRRATRLSKRSTFHHFNGNPLKYSYQETLNTAIHMSEKKIKFENKI